VVLRELLDQLSLGVDREYAALRQAHLLVSVDILPKEGQHGVRAAGRHHHHLGLSHPSAPGDPLTFALFPKAA